MTNDIITIKIFKFAMLINTLTHVKYSVLTSLERVFLHDRSTWMVHLSFETLY